MLPSLRRALVALLLLAVPCACTSGGQSSTSSATTSSAEASPIAETSPEVAPTGNEAVAAGGSGARYPDQVALLNAGSEADDWILPQKDYENNRFTPLDQITPQNVGTLAKAWTTQIADDGEQESAPIVWHGTLYIATPHDNVLAFDATTGQLKWQFPYTPRHVLAYAVNRGVGIADGRIFFATQDCRVIALDADSGKQVWNVNGCPNAPNNNSEDNWFSMAAYVYKGSVILGTAGGDFGNVGQVIAFSALDGHKLWSWQTIPGPGQPGHETWPGDSWKHGGAAVWSGLTIDPQTQMLYIAPGNPGPNLTMHGHQGRNLYTDSLVALDISGNQPKLRWYYQVRQDDTHDADPAMYPILFNGKVKGATRHLVTVGDKAGEFVVLDATNGRQLYRMALDNQTGINKPPTIQGTEACPNHGGGIEWNGGAYDPATNYFLVPSTEECALWKIKTNDPTWTPGQPYSAGPLPKRQPATGKATAIDIATGKIAWVRRFPYPGEGGVTVTKSGIAFVPDTGGNLYALDPRSGKVLWKSDTGSSIVAAPTIYRAGGSEYVVQLSGEAGNQQTPNLPKTHGSVLTAYRLGPVSSPRVNSAASQSAPGSAVQNANQPPSTGSAPYTPQQVAAGGKLYGQYCQSCHGAQLQGVSAPALTGPSLANAHLNLSQMRTIVTQQMPLNAPGSLKPDQYADIIAYLLSYDCVAHSQGATEPFPTTDRPEFKKVVFGGRSCPAKQGSGGHE